MQFAIFLQAASHNQVYCLQFCTTLIQQNHQINIIFCSDLAVTIGLKQQPNIWQNFIQQHNIKFLLCRSAIHKLELNEQITDSWFKTGNIGEWLLHSGSSDRIVQFK